MAEAFFSTNGNVRAIGSLRRGANGQPRPLDASIPDGDTVGIHLEGSGAVRFLGVDTPEKNFQLAGSSAQRRLDSEEWDAYLTDPFLPQFGPFELDADLENHLRGRLGTGAGYNHRFHGDKAEQELIGLVQADMDALGQSLTTFRYFLSFSFEVFDSFGRFLAFINRHQPKENGVGPRPPSYNERMLARGAAMPFFVWPNIDPFRHSASLLEAVIPPMNKAVVNRGHNDLVKIDGPVNLPFGLGRPTFRFKDSGPISKASLSSQGICGLTVCA